MLGTLSFLKQSFPGKPTFTEEHMPELTGKVAIVTGSNTGLGKEAAQILYAKGAQVYMMAPSQPAANDEYEKRGSFEAYCLSKLGGYYYAAEYAARQKSDGIVSVSLNPGALDSDFWREQGAITTYILRKTLLYPPKMGAYTVLFAALSPEVTLDKSGRFIAPWGRFWELSPELVAATKPKSENGTEEGPEFWRWTETQLRPYL